jgi:pSer/pThr/pTyr-binding forkhead associated (FHA) protein
MKESRRKVQVAILHVMNPATGAARELKLSAPECSVGSEETNEVFVRDGSVSRRHARFRRRWRKWQIIDTGSSNGTYVASQRVTRWTTLRDGQEVRLGGARFVFNSAARVTSGLSLLQRFSKLGAILAVVVTALVVGFAGTQFFLYRKYHRQLASSKTERKGQETVGMNPRAGTPPESSNPPREKEVPAQR